MKKAITKRELDRIRGYQVYNMRSAAGNTVPNQFILHAQATTIFQSYRTIIAIKRPGKKTVLDLNWDYSGTTSKYRNQFLNEKTDDTRKKIESGEYLIVDLN